MPLSTPKSTLNLDATGGPAGTPERRARPRTPCPRDALCFAGRRAVRAAAVRDVSAGGLCLLLPSPVDAGEALTALVLGEGGRTLALRCRVVWAWPDGPGWAAGCGFPRDLTAGELAALGVAAPALPTRVRRT